jgi:seryl-tRNA synthetase
LEILSELGLPHQLIGICTGDLGSGKYVQNDIECWMPSRNAYGETHSVSSLLDFQSRRLNIRYRDVD